MIPAHVALVDESDTIDKSTLAEVAGALNEQIQADFTPAWPVHATIGAYPIAPPGTWAIRLRDGIGEPGAAGYHTDEHRQPYALVDLAAGDWTVTASHELLEILADPFGSRMHTALGPVGSRQALARERVRYLVEVCDPVEATTYEVGGVAVSDFILPAFYRTSPRRGAAYSHMGVLAGPRVVNPGGYVSFADATGVWWQQFVDEHGIATERRLGTFDGAGSLREWTDHAATTRGST